MLPLLRTAKTYIATAVAIACAVSIADAHPLGNNSITQFNIIYPYKDRVEIEYFVDFAELPSEQLLKDLDADEDGIESPAESEAWARQRIQSLQTELSVTLNGEPLNLVIKKKKTADGKEQDWYSLSKFPGQLRGFWNVKFLARFRADYRPNLLKEVNEIVYEDPAYPDTRGLRRILIDLSDEQKTKVEIVDKDISSVEEEINPFAYEQYDPFNPPLEEVATYQFKIVGWRPPPASSPASLATQADQAVPLAGVRDDASQEKFKAAGPKSNNPIIKLLEKRELNFWLLLSGAIAAMGWGAAHALAPGHAKTAVAAYLISQHGTFVHAVALAVTVTVTHVLFVVLLGLVILGIGLQTGSTMQLWLGLISGALIAIMGGVLIFRAQTGRIAHHDHDHDHSHHHHDNKIPNTAGAWLRSLFSHSHPHLPDHAHAEHAHSHDHDHPHPHSHQHEHHHHDSHDSHHDHSHDHDHDHPHPHPHDHDHGHAHTHPTAGGITAKQIILLGIAGGMVPCPAATGIMLAGISADRVVLGLAAVGVFSIGLALMLMAVGVFALTSHRFATKILRNETDPTHTRSSRILTKYLPTASGMVVALFGCLISVHYAYMLATGRPLIPWLA